MCGRGLSASGTKLAFRSTDTATVPSSMYLTVIDFDEEMGLVIGRGMGGLRRAALYLMIKIRPPNNAP